MSVAVEHLIYGDSAIPGVTGLQALAKSPGISPDECAALERRADVGDWLNTRLGYDRCHHAAFKLGEGRWCFSVRARVRRNDGRREAIAHLFVFTNPILLDDPFAVFEPTRQVRCEGRPCEIQEFWDAHRYANARYADIPSLDVEPCGINRGERLAPEADEWVSSAATTLQAFLDGAIPVLLPQGDAEDLVRWLWLSLPLSLRSSTGFSTHAFERNASGTYAFANTPFELLRRDHPARNLPSRTTAESRWWVNEARGGFCGEVASWTGFDGPVQSGWAEAAFRLSRWVGGEDRLRTAEDIADLGVRLRRIGAKPSRAVAALRRDLADETIPFSRSAATQLSEFLQRMNDAELDDCVQACRGSGSLIFAALAHDHTERSDARALDVLERTGVDDLPLTEASELVGRHPELAAKYSLKLAARSIEAGPDGFRFFLETISPDLDILRQAVDQTGTGLNAPYAHVVVGHYESRVVPPDELAEYLTSAFGRDIAIQAARLGPLSNAVVARVLGSRESANDPARLASLLTHYIRSNLPESATGVCKKSAPWAVETVWARLSADDKLSLPIEAVEDLMKRSEEHLRFFVKHWESQIDIPGDTRKALRDLESQVLNATPPEKRLLILSFLCECFPGGDRLYLLSMDQIGNYADSADLERAEIRRIAARWNILATTVGLAYEAELSERLAANGNPIAFEIPVNRNRTWKSLVHGDRERRVRNRLRENPPPGHEQDCPVFLYEKGAHR